MPAERRFRPNLDGDHNYAVGVPLDDNGAYKLLQSYGTYEEFVAGFEAWKRFANLDGTLESPVPLEKIDPHLRWSSYSWEIMEDVLVNSILEE